MLEDLVFPTIICHVDETNVKNIDFYV